MLRSLLAPAAAGVVMLPGGCDRPAGAGGPVPTTRLLGGLGRGAGEFFYPRAIDADERGLWVIDKSARVQHLDPRDGRVLDAWSMPESALGKPTGVTAGPGPDGAPALYVPDTHYHRVLVYPAGPSGREGHAGAPGPPEPVLTIGTYGHGPGQFVYPTDVAVLVGPDGRAARLYVSEYGGNDRVSAFAPTGEFLFSFGGPGRGDDPGAVRFDRPQSVLIDAARAELIVADACNHRLGRFTLDGGLLGWIGGPDATSTPPAPGEPARFTYPYGLARLDDGTLLVAEYGGNRVQRINPDDGRSLGWVGGAGRGPGELASPWGVAVRGGEVFVLDSGNNRIQAFDAPGWGRRAAR